MYGDGNRGVLSSGDYPPSPLGVRSHDELTERLRALRAWAGGPSYAAITRRIAAARAARNVPSVDRTPGRVTVYSCFQPGRRRLDAELVVDVVGALGVAEADAIAWRQACRTVGGAIGPAAVVSVSAALPARPTAFIGRHDELELVRSAPDAAVIAIEGMAGIGKSQFAVHASHELMGGGRGRDVRLFADLRGFDVDPGPADPEAVLDGFLRLLAVPGSEIDHRDLPARVARYRAALRDRSVLIVLDNAASGDQVAPLLPDGPNCLVLVTSRRRLDIDAVSVPLAALDPTESVELLGAAAGADRMASEPEAAARIAELCGHLPLDLAVTGADIRRRAGWSLADIVARLESIPRGEAVRPALAASYHSLPSDHRELFRLLALHPGRHISVAAAAALGGVDRTAARAVLDRLLVEHLLAPVPRGRYEFHTLVRSYALLQVIEEVPHSAQHAALTRLQDYYRHVLIRSEFWQPPDLLGTVADIEQWEEESMNEQFVLDVMSYDDWEDGDVTPYVCPNVAVS